MVERERKVASSFVKFDERLFRLTFFFAFGAQGLFLFCLLFMLSAR